MPQKKDTVNFTMCRAIRLHGMRIKAIGRKLKKELQSTRGPFISISKSFYKKRLYKESEGKAKERGITHAMKGASDAIVYPGKLISRVKMVVIIYFGYLILISHCYPSSSFYTCTYAYMNIQIMNR